MSEKLSHEEISAQFLDSGSMNFEAVGEFLSKIGPELVVRDDGLHGVIYGRFSGLACFLRPDDLHSIFGGVRAATGLAGALDLPKA